MKNKISPAVRKQVLIAQKNEITEYHIYHKLATVIGNLENAKILARIGDDEKKHYEFWKQFTDTEVAPSKWAIFKFYWIARIFGLTFGIKLMEKGEASAQVNYSELSKYIPEAKQIMDDEHEHEQALIKMINEERLNYVGSIVLGLNDALVELTGTLAGLTFAFQNTRLIALSGLITGIAASFSMAASEYLSNKADGNGNAMKASVYTGIAYILTVLLLVTPYFLIDNYYICLAITLAVAVFIIAFFNFYISVAKDYPFRKHFLEMAGISMGVAALSFGIGVLIRMFIGVDI